MGNILETKELDFVVLEFHENFVVSKLKEGVILDQVNLNSLVKTCTGFYKDRKFGYIAKRFNNYNVDPLIYFNLTEVKNLTGIAIVCHNTSSLNTAKFEKKFSKVPFEVFLDFEEAVTWTLHRLENKKADL